MAPIDAWEAEMADIQVEQKHSLSIDEAKQRIGGFEEMLSKYGVKVDWRGGSGTLNGTGVSGGIDVTASTVKVIVKLGLMARAVGVDPVKLKGSIEKRLKAAFERRSVDSIKPTPVNVDNTGVISMLEGVTIKAASRHIFRTLAEARELVQLDAVVIPVKVDTEVNIANALTKQELSIHASAAQLRQITGPMSA